MVIIVCFQTISSIYKVIFLPLASLNFFSTGLYSEDLNILNALLTEPASKIYLV